MCSNAKTQQLSSGHEDFSLNNNKGKHVEEVFFNVQGDLLYMNKAAFKRQLIHLLEINRKSEKNNKRSTNSKMDAESGDEGKQTHTEAQMKEAKRFSEFYIDLIENHRESFSYHLSDNAVLDWFGQTVKGDKNIKVFLKDKVATVKHIFPNIEPCSTIGYRDTHIINYTLKDCDSYTKLGLPNDEEKTPPNIILSPGSSRKRERGQGDGLHNYSGDSTPAKRARVAAEVSNSSLTPPVEIMNITSDGHIEFHRKSTKKYQQGTKWARPCKFQVAFSQSPNGYVIHLIIYQANMKCRRNLLKDFHAAEKY